MAVLNFLEETRFEKLPVSIYTDHIAASKVVAKRIGEIITTNDNLGKKTVLGLATGATPLHVYKELVRLHKQEGLSFKNVITFNLDEYYPMQAHAAQSYVTYMNENLFYHIDIDHSNVHIPDGALSEDAIATYCLQYEKAINDCGGIDIQLLGIGRTGHIGFNEPGSAPNSGTRLVTLADLTRSDASQDFGGKENVPTKAITMGVGTVFKAKEIILMAWGHKKASIIRQTLECNITSDIPATYLQLSDKVQFVLDEGAASELTRFNTPWLVKDCVWDDYLIKKAVIWLSGKVSKPILKLTDDDYNKNGMAQLATVKGPVYDINIKIFNQLQHTITGWPGGKPNVDDSQRPERAEPALKRSIIFSPHPDDDVISMGGTFIRLADHGHDVHVAYQTSGNNAVWDHDALRFFEFLIDFNRSLDIAVEDMDALYRDVVSFLKTKKPNQTDTDVIKTIKGLIRKGEAIAGARFVGLENDYIHFLNLQFYEMIKKQKDFNFEADIIQTKALLKSIKPHQIFAAGDFADPHGTHKICFDIIHEALKQLRTEGEEWINDCWVWLYRGAWHEFEIHEIEMAVPLSPMEVERKRNAIFKHQSQKDYPVFPGEDAREFWVRAEARTRETAQAYNDLGLAEYEAIEAFVRFMF